MKKMMMVLMMVFSQMFLVTAAMAELEWAQALVSGPALRSFLEERSVKAFVSLDGEHVYDSSGNYASTNSTSANLRNAVRAIRLKASFDPQYPKFWTRIQYYDMDNNTTLYGVESVEALKKGGVWVIPTSVTLRVPNYWVSLPIPNGENVWNVNVRVYDQKGQLVGYRTCGSYTGQSGQRYIRYPGWITGDQLALSNQYAEVQIMVDDQKGGYSTMVINPSTGKEKVTDEVSATLNPMIEGREYMAPNQSINATILSQNSTGINPVYQLPITALVTLTVKAKTSEGEVAKTFWYRKLANGKEPGDTEWKSYPTGQVQFQPGVYDIWFEWETFHEDSYHQLWENDSGGKG